jgi:hypothetical protein
MNLEQKIRTNQFFLDEETRQLTLLDSRYYSSDGGETYYPSTTTVLDAYPKTAQFYEWLKRTGEAADDIRDEAGERGSNVHKLTEAYDRGETISLIDVDGKIRYKSTEWKMVERYIDFTNVVAPQIIRTEYNLISPKLGYAGTIDRNVYFDYKKLKGNFLIDIKTSNSLHDHYYLQLAAYVKLHEEEFVEERIDGAAILWLNAKTRGESKTNGIQGKGWQLVFPPKPIEHYYRLFKHTQALWNEVNGDMKPNNLTYNIEYKR